MEDIYFVLGVSFNQPKLCPSAVWAENGTTFADNISIGANPHSIFINTINTVYAANSQDGRIQTWSEGSAGPTRTIATNSTNPYSLFVSLTGEIYIDNWNFKRVDVWQENASSYVSKFDMGGACYSIFVDTNDSLYCSLLYYHAIIKRSVNSSGSQNMTVAGTGCPGYLSHTLFYPRGIFVTMSFALYVADSQNHRVQLFRSGEVEWNNGCWKGRTRNY